MRRSRPNSPVPRGRGTSATAFRIGVAAAVLAGCGEPSGPEFTPDETASRAVIGQVHALDDESVSGMTARVRWSGQDVSAAVAADGSFAVPLEDEVTGFGQLSIEGPESGGLNPAWVLLLPGDVNALGRIVLVPSRWTVEAGTRAGSVVDIRPDLATDTRVMPSYWGTFFPFRQQGYLQTVLDPTQWTGAFSTWASDGLPIPVAFDRIGSDAPFSDADSAAFWGHVDAMEEALGRDVFEPTPVDSVQILGGTRRADGAILIQLDSALASRGVGDLEAGDGRTWSLTADASEWSGGPVQRVSFISEDITGARIRFHAAEALHDRALVVHELMHTLGVGHGCSWPSVQTYCESLRRELPTAHDVAYLEVLEAIRDLERDVGTRWGLVAATLGARAVRLGEGPVPDIELVFGPSSAPSGS